MNGSIRSTVPRMLVARVLLVATVLQTAVPTRARGQEAAAADTSMRKIALRQLPANAPVIGLEFTVIHIDENGVRKPVDRAPETYPFKIGDSFLVQIKPKDDLFIYVFTEGPGGERSRLLPRDLQKPLRVTADTVVDIPSDGDLFTFEAPAGEEKLIVVAMKEHDPNNLGGLLAQAFQVPGQKLQSSNQTTKMRGGKREMSDRVDKLTTPHAGGVQLEATPDRETPLTEVVGVNTSKLVVGISLNSRGQGSQAR